MVVEIHMFLLRQAYASVNAVLIKQLLKAIARVSGTELGKGPALATDGQRLGLIQRSR